MIHGYVTRLGSSRCLLSYLLPALWPCHESKVNLHFMNCILTAAQVKGEVEERCGLIPGHAEVRGPRGWTIFSKTADSWENPK